MIQRVSRAAVKVSEHTSGSINKGLLILLGVEDADNEEDIAWLSNKIINLRVFDDEEGVMNLSVKDVKGDLLVVSQFTLHASTKKGNRPSYIRASKPDIAIGLYEKFVSHLENEFGEKVETGVFGADMKVELVNDGPVTIIIDTKNPE